LGEAAAGLEEAMDDIRDVGKMTDNLPRIVDARSGRRKCARHVELGEATAGVEEAVATRAVEKIPDDLPRVVDAVGLRNFCACYVELGKAASSIKVAVVTRTVKKPTICPASLMP